LLLEERREREKKSNPPIENCKTRWVFSGRRITFQADAIHNE
jgi:hypothetical protein